MAFAVIYDTTTRIVQSVKAGVASLDDIDIPTNCEAILKDSIPTVIGPKDTVDENGNIVPYSPTPPTEEEMKQAEIRRYETAVQAHLDAKAREKGYANIISACSYAGYDNPFKMEACDYLAWRGDCWKYCYVELDKIDNGDREPPASPEAFVQELPQLTFPYTPIDWSQQ